MARARRPAVDAEDVLVEARGEWLKRADEERKVNRAEAEAERSINLVQTALAGAVNDYVSPDHQPGEQFPGRQPPTTQLSLFETGFKRPFRWDEVAGGRVPGC